MSTPPKILAFAGSLRAESYNKKLVQIAAAGARNAGAEVTYIDLRDFPLPIFDEDYEATVGLPPQAQQLKALFMAHQGLLIASPEYNSSMTAVLKNTIDWVSRPVAGQPRLAEFVGKVAGLCSASPGELGGLRGLVHVRALLGNIFVMVIPEQQAITKAHEAFGPDGQLKDNQRQASVIGLGRRVAEVLSRLNAN